MDGYNISISFGKNKIQVIAGGFRVATDEQAFDIRYSKCTQIIDCAQMLLESDFLKAPLADDEWRTQIGSDNVQYLLRLRRRLERITRYRTGAEYFVRHGMSLFTKVTPSAQRVNIGLQWVGNVPEPGGPPFTLREHFRRGKRYKTMDYVPVKVAASPVHIHPEVALMSAKTSMLEFLVLDAGLPDKLRELCGTINTNGSHNETFGI
ncbi:hypothetical protein A0H81_07912 [Grifola frondosa]|uniref:Uncharacterized protein n=1 Tax=Grifola frondosa TaxID=5627 RepID=A0A1C7M8D9_GRIFR|nr:hypothetical protein A0H81_07912 [Grifola frondosa]